jgi:transcription antitermination factor NusG
VLRCGNLIQYARKGDVEALQAGDATRRTIAAPGTSYAPGEAVSVRTGPLGGHHGVVVRTTASHAVVALLLMGRLVEASVRLDALTRPAA